MTTKTLFLNNLYTQIYDPSILGPTNRLFATWELQSLLRVPVATKAKARDGGTEEEEVLARTFDAKGNVRGEWRVRWTLDPSDSEQLIGQTSQTGKVLRYAYLISKLATVIMGRRP